MAAQATPSKPAAKKKKRGFVKIREAECKGCGCCVADCPRKVLQLSDRLNQMGYHPAEYIGEGCIACGICFYACPEPGAITVFELDEDE